jgi:branched-subunit amino acid aminotransferase/4-amino-4-deoxychorismate lyase
VNEPGRHILLNGEIIDASDPVLFHDNRLFCFGDGLSETMHAYGTNIQFSDSHFRRLYNGMRILKMEISDLIEKNKILREITRLLNRDKLFGGIRVRLSVYRDSKGFLMPEVNNVSYLVECTPLEPDTYQLNHTGYTIGIYPDMNKPITPMSNYVTANSLLGLMAAIYAKEQKYDDVLILNVNSGITECMQSNIFFVKNNILFTPGLSSGCVAGIMREQVISVAGMLKLEVRENNFMNEQNMIAADEVFLTNAVEGIRWVLAYKQRRYYNQITSLINDKLNKEVFK